MCKHTALMCKHTALMCKHTAHMRKHTALPAACRERLEAAVSVILSYQNRDGGMATYENTRSFHALEVCALQRPAAAAAAAIPTCYCHWYYYFLLLLLIAATTVFLHFCIPFLLLHAHLSAPKTVCHHPAPSNPALLAALLDPKPPPHMCSTQILNPAETFGDIIVDYSYVECTSACITALAAFDRLYPDSRRGCCCCCCC